MGNSSRKVIWIINQYAKHLSEGKKGRHHFIAEELADRGYEVFLISSNQANTSLKMEQELTQPKTTKYQHVVLNVPSYPNSESYKRVLGWFIFAYKLKQLPRTIDRKPDFIYYSSLSLPGSYTAANLSKQLGAKFVFEVRDVWPLTLITLGGKSKFHPLVLLLQRLEDRAYKKADLIFSNLKGVSEHVENRGGDVAKFHWIPNGFSQSLYQESDSHNAFDRKNNNLDSSEKKQFVVGYAGSMGRANALDTLIDAATILRDYSEIRFVLVGEGSHKERLAKLVEDRGLDNVEFRAAVPKESVPELVQSFNVGYRGSRNAGHYQFGMAPNKVFDYIALGKPIIQSYSGRFDIVKEYQAGWTIAAESPELLAEEIKHIYEMSPEEFNVFEENARTAAWENHEFGKITEKLLGAINRLDLS